MSLVRVCKVDELLPGSEGRRVETDGTAVAIFNVDGEFYAIGDTCSHEEASLSEGFVEEDIVECPRHGAQFHIPTGQNRTLPATRPVPTFPVKVEGDEVFVEVSNG
jgi:3-phenylpropionate/trans-cinnamate dioxygenase ferredoxin component